MHDVMEEYVRAANSHASSGSRHEAYAILLEEVDEFWDEVKKRHPDEDNMRKELVQVAAMAIRAIIDLELEGSNA